MLHLVASKTTTTQLHFQQVAPIVTTDNAFLNEDNEYSENSMKVQDSLLYQDYSYINKS